MSALDQTIKFIEANKSNTFVYETDISDPLFQSKAPYLELLLDAPYAGMLQEARALKDRFVTHRPQDGEGWRSLCVHGISAEKTGVPEEYGYTSDQVPYSWTDIAPLCPVTVDYFKNKFPYQNYDRIRYMLLEPDGYISPHFDNPESFLGSAVNISLNNPENCRLVTTSGEVPFKDSGSAFLFNTNYTHAVYNNSHQDRFHIIVHGTFASDWQKVVRSSYRAALKKQINPSQS
jgi:hypothetical protein